MSLFAESRSESAQGPRRLTNATPRLAPDRKEAAKRVACADQDLHAGNEAWFEIYRAERVTLTSILFSGEDWRWRFCSNAGLTIASGAGFRTEGECIAAVDALRRNAGAARVRGMSVRPS
jgi:uncharacterized protein YegP (UPF0339 family)